MLLPLGILGSFLLNNFLKETYSSRKLEIEKSIGNILDKNVDLGDYVGIRFLGISLGNTKINDKKNIYSEIMIIGFIGTGKISSSIILGIFKSKLNFKRIYISSRNRNIAKKLAKKFTKVKILNDNQEIIDKSSTVFLGVTPNVGNKILSKLRFSKNKKIISLISTINLSKLKQVTKNKNVVRATPLPPIEIKKGPVIICPPSKFAKNIFKHLGQVLEIRNEKLSYKFWSTASLMATYYEILNTSSKWLTKKGINKKLADTYVAELFLALSQDALNKSSQGYKKLVADSQTPKGLNMQVLNELKKGKFFTKFSKALENVNKRVSK